jgi:glycosyltransferase involved in cell wall biosynthesis
MSINTAKRLILHVIPDLGIGGAEAVLAQLATAPSTAPWRHMVVSLLPGGYHAAMLRAAGIEVIEFDFNTLPGIAKGLAKLARLIFETKPLIVQGWMYYGDLVGLLGTYLAQRRRRTKVIWTIRCSNMDFSRYRLRLRIAVELCRWLSPNPNVIIANSSAGLQVHRAIGYKPRNSVVIHNGVDVNRFKPDAIARAAIRDELRIPEDAVLLVHIARLDPMKDHQNFLSAMEHLPELQAILLGDGTEKLVTPANVRSLGVRTDVAPYLAAADFVVSSSAFGEGSSNVLIEAMACGLPVIATDVGDAALIVNDAGIVVRPGDTDALREAIQSLTSEPKELYGERSRHAREHVINRFAKTISVQKFDALYNSLTQPAQGGRHIAGPNSHDGGHTAPLDLRE